MPLSLQTQHGITQFDEAWKSRQYDICRALCYLGLASAVTRDERLRWFNNLVGTEWSTALFLSDRLTALSISDASTNLAFESLDYSLKGHYHNNRAAVLSALERTDEAYLEYAMAAKYYAESEREDLVAEVLNNTGCL